MFELRERDEERKELKQHPLNLLYKLHRTLTNLTHVLSQTHTYCLSLIHSHMFLHSPHGPHTHSHRLAQSDLPPHFPVSLQKHFQRMLFPSFILPRKGTANLSRHPSLTSKKRGEENISFISGVLSWPRTLVLA